MIMTDNQNFKIKKTVSLVVSLLVSGSYKRIEALSNGVRLKAKEIQAGVDEYGCRLCIPPDSAFDRIDVIQLKAVNPCQYSIRFRLFTEEEGESDLEIQMTLTDEPNRKSDGLMSVEIDNILVA